MSPSREPAQPPRLDGYTFKRVLGSGGFADVFLYERALPQMPVAVKVLVASALTDDDQRRFTQEANVMARFYSHPYIVGILNATVSDDGRPYIVMEYYPKDNLWVRARRSPLSVTEALRTGIQIASAVETAHRAGVIHRDVKPANVLTSEFGDPGLTDFGISAAKGIGQHDGGGESGLSIPWSPPEAFDSDALLDECSDVYSLGATLYSTLTGRSPFEAAGGLNAAVDLMQRIERDALRPTGRADVPASLERVLSQAMAKQPDRRHPTALALARDLQSVEQELHLKMTTVVVPDDAVEPPEGSSDLGADETRAKAPRFIDPTAGPAVATSTRRRPSVASGPMATSTPGAGSATPPGTITGVPGSGDRSAPAGMGAAPAAGTLEQQVHAGRDPVHWEPHQVAGTRRRIAPVVPTESPADTPAPPSVREREGRPLRPGRAVAAFVVSLALIGVVVAVVLAGGGSPGPTASSTTAPVVTSEVQPPTPTQVTAVADGAQVTITWTDPEHQPGDQFVVLETIAGQQVAPAPQTDRTSLVTTDSARGQLCAQVELVRQDGRESQPSAPSCTS